MIQIFIQGDWGHHSTLQLIRCIFNKIVNIHIYGGGEEECSGKLCSL